MIEQAWSRLSRYLDYRNFGMRGKLILLFVVIKVAPLCLLAFMAWAQFAHLSDELTQRTEVLAYKARTALAATGDLAVADAIQALDNLAQEDIERMTTDAARRVADFLYARDADIRFLASLAPDNAVYAAFMASATRRIVVPGPWKLNADGVGWEPATPDPDFARVTSSNAENAINFRYRPPVSLRYEERPLYLELAFIDLEGRQQVKAVNPDRMPTTLLDVSRRENTYVRAETYFQELQRLRPGDIYVSEVIGAYVPSRLIGMYTPENAKKAGVPFNPEQEAFAGKENPVGKRFRGIVRWATPVVRDGVVTGYVTAALDHDHLMAFMESITPARERYSELPDAYEGNYAFIWDHKGRSVVHPRHHFIAGYDPETGDPQVPWLEESIYDRWVESGKDFAEFIADEPVFVEQSVKKRAAPELTAKGLVGLDCRYLNFAPQCTGWFDLTAKGGSGSFNILWSGLRKLTTAATIPYYTGQYADSPRGFGFVAVGAGLEDFHRPATETGKVLTALLTETDSELKELVSTTKNLIQGSLVDTTLSLSVGTLLMILVVVFIAVLMASVFTSRITGIITGISRFRNGERQFRFNAPVKDEMGVLCDSFDRMADSVEKSVLDTLIITDLNGVVVYANTAFLAARGLPHGQVIGRPYNEVSFFTHKNPLDSLLDGEDCPVEFYAPAERYYKGVAEEFRNDQGETTGYFIMAADVTGMVETQRELEHAVHVATEASMAKSQFLANMSHEIRTPMNAILGLSHIALKDPELGEVQRDMMQKIHMSATGLLGVINDILDFSKIEARKLDMETAAFLLRDQLCSAMDMLRFRAAEKHIGLEACMSAEAVALPTLMGDPGRLRQVIINLMGNAVKFTEHGGVLLEVTVDKAGNVGRAEAPGAVLCFRTCDTGIGMDEESLSKLFTPFTQVDSSHTRRFGGTGLGLVISKELVELMGGTLWVESDPGLGSCFCCTIPFAFGEASAPAVKTGPPTQASLDTLCGKRVLLVEDNEINQLVARNLLEQYAIDVSVASNGAEAVEFVAKQHFDLVLMDIQMPVMDGLEATRLIRSRPMNGDLPIVAMTAHAMTDDHAKSMNAGMNAHITKPIDPDVLFTTLLRWM